MKKCCESVDCWRGSLRWTVVKLFSCFLVASLLLEAGADLQNETAVLLSIKQAWGNPKVLDGWLNPNLTCSWLFVTCDPQNTTILELIFDGGNVNSSLPEIIGELKNLEILTVQGWGLTGAIPSSIGGLKNLSKLALIQNSLTGFIPPELGNLTNLQSLDLSDNLLNGTIPAKLSQLQLLTDLTLSNNQFSGNLPSWLGSFPLLSSLKMDHNDFQGIIPPELGNLTNLVNFSLSNNGLTGPLAQELGNLSSISDMELDFNSLNGSLPDSFVNLKRLTILMLNNNMLSGSIPAWIGNLTGLTALLLNGNQISGILPDELGNAVSLGNVNIGQNGLTGHIPEQLSQLSNLVVLELYQNRLSGSIPSGFIRMINLSYLDLSGNYLTGIIPASLVSLPNLTELYLQDNCLNGSIPHYNQSEANLSFNFGSSNGSNCFNGSNCKCATSLPALSPVQSYVPQGRNKSNGAVRTISIAVAVAGGSLLALLGVLVFYICCLRNSRDQKKLITSNTFRGSVKQYSLAEIIKATNNFSTSIGGGGQASVYKAVFSDETVAAVKRFDKKRSLQDFELEVGLLPQLHHRFLVNLVGYCEEQGELMLLFEYMDGGSLYDNLHGEKARSSPLTWDERVRVIISMAYGIEYLHYGSSKPIIHRDIKSANILLSSRGSTLTAKVADLGLGKLTVIDPSKLETGFADEPPKSLNPSMFVGSPGYFDPEYFNTSNLSHKSDVYSFGVVLLELITGRKSIIERRVSLVEWAKHFLEQEEMLKIVDPNLEEGTYSQQQLVDVAVLARLCIAADSRQRPTIRGVLEFLKGVFRVEAGLVNPADRNISTLEVSFTQTEDLVGETSVDCFPDSDTLLPRE